MPARIIILAVILAAAVTGDILRCRISNVIVAAGLSAGFLMNFLTEGAGGLIKSSLGALLPVLFLFALFALRMLGAGDIKLFCAVGAIMGAEFTAYATAFSFLAGGIIAIAVMLARGNVRKRFAFVAVYLKTVFLTQSFVPYTDFNDKGDGAKFRFSPAIAAGCCIEAVLLLSAI